MRKQPDHTAMMQTAEGAIRHAQDVRAFHRKRTRIGDKQRNTDIKHAEARVIAAMRPIRSAIGRIPYDPSNDATKARHGELRAMSKRVQAERRKLWKLRGSLKGRPVAKTRKAKP